MKKTSIILGMLLMGFASQAQTRLCLYEEFTGENCPPCAATNPAFDALMALATNTAKAQVIKWQVAIPSAPSNTWSLYQTNSAEINARDSYYSINSAPSGKMDGQSQVVFGATSDHPANSVSGWGSSNVTAAQTVTTPFALTMNTAWDGTFSNAVVTITVTSSTAFTANGALKLRLVLTEKTINFATAPGTNGEKDFHWVVRKSFPDIVNGTALPGTWTPSQTQTYTLNCAVPSYIVDKGQMAFIAFIQDDGNKKIYQAGRDLNLPQIPNEAKAISASATSVVCTSTAAPMVTIKNNGINAITSLTIMPSMNSVNGTSVVVPCNLAVGASTTIQMAAEPLINGTNLYSFNITGVSGGDVVSSNNIASTTFYNALTYSTSPILEDFSSATFPPAGFGVFNPSNAKWPWSRSTSAGGFGLSSSSTYLFINWTAGNATHELMLPGSSFTGTMFPSLKFDLAYAQLSTSGNDILQVQASTNCGSSWTTVWQNQGTAMATAPPFNSSLFIPSASQWSAVTVPMYTYSNTANVLVRFHAIGGTSAGQGNAIYLDNINIFDQPTTGLSSNLNNANSFDVYPNPASNEVNLKIETSTSASSTIKVVNTLGQVVIAKQVSLSIGVNTIPVDTKQLSSGIYYVTYDAPSGSVTKKLTITK